MKPKQSQLQEIRVLDDAAIEQERLKRDTLERIAVCALGSPKQRKQHAVGLLPEEELLSLVRTHLFAAFNRFDRWRKIKPGDVRHRDGCTERSIDAITFETCDLDTKSVNQYALETWDAIQVSAELVRSHDWVTRGGDRVTVEPVTHWATCKACHAEISRSSVRVSIGWAGRTLTREYDL